jgi:hypothetical protein
VLEPSNIGITISSTSRFYSTVALLVSDLLSVLFPEEYASKSLTSTPTIIIN